VPLTSTGGGGGAITVNELKDVVNMWMQRETGSEEVDYLSRKGGDAWIQQGLNTDFKRGINAATLAERDAMYGNNRKEKVHLKGFWELVWNALKDFLLRVLIVAGIASIVINMIMEEHERHIAWIEGAAILLSVAIVVLVNVFNDMKKEREFQRLNDLAEAGKKICIVRDGVTKDDASIEDVMVGDLIVLKSGMEVAGDGYVTEGFSLQLDESSMTGETKPMVKDSIENCLKKKQDLIKERGPGKIGHHDIPSPIILAGTKVLAGTGHMIVINVGKNSAIGKIKDIMNSGEEELTPLQLKLEKIARDIGWFGLTSACVIFVALMLRFVIENSIYNDPKYQEDRIGWGNRKAIEHVNDVLQYLLISITVLVVAIPEGLPLAVTLSLAFSVSQMMKDNNLVRKLQACETMGGANIICSDKTGTLTRNEMYWTHFWNVKERNVFDAERNQPLHYDQYTHDSVRDLFLNSIVLNSLDDPAKKEGNPTEMAILKYLHSTNFPVVEHRNKHTKAFQATFSSDRKRMSTVIRMPNGEHYAFIKGASEYIMQMSDKMLDLETGRELQLTPDIKKSMEDAIEAMASKALRTIGLAYKRVSGMDELNTGKPDERGIFDYEKSGFTMVGICGIKDIIRAEVPDSVRKCHTAGIQVKMVTGDNKITARAIAKEVGIINAANDKSALVMEGPEFLRKIGGVVCDNCRTLEKCECVANESDLSKAENKGKKIRKDTVKNKEEFDAIWRNLCVLARSRPEDKYALVIGLKERENVVAVTGDGTNDAPALSKANVGFAMGIAGTEVAKQAASILIMDDNFASIVQAVKWGRNIYDAIRKFLQFQLTVNVVAVFITLVSALAVKDAVLSTVQMLWINLIMDTLAALALATEPPYDELLLRPPQGKNEYIISPYMMRNILVGAAYQLTVLIVLLFAGPYFLVDPIGGRQLQPYGSRYVVSGRTSSLDGFPAYNRNYYDGRYSVHYTYIFNTFVLMQVFNFFNSRILDDSLNIFWRALRSRYLLVIIVIIVVLQLILLTFAGVAIRVVQWGLDPVGWIISILFAIAIWVVMFFAKLLGTSTLFKKCFKGYGNQEISKAELDRRSTISIRRTHTKQFMNEQPAIHQKRSVIEDRLANPTSVPR